MRGYSRQRAHLHCCFPTYAFAPPCPTGPPRPFRLPLNKLPTPSCCCSRRRCCRYVVKDLLGQGTFGQVFRCVEQDSGALVAVKVIKNQPAYYHQARVEVGVLQYLNTRADPGDKHHIVRMKVGRALCVGGRGSSGCRVQGCGVGREGRRTGTWEGEENLMWIQIEAGKGRSLQAVALGWAFATVCRALAHSQCQDAGWLPEYIQQEWVQGLPFLLLRRR